MLDQDNSGLTVRNGTLPPALAACNERGWWGAPAAPSQHLVPPNSTLDPRFPFLGNT